jgi:hypothetical protein
MSSNKVYNFDNDFSKFIDTPLEVSNEENVSENPFSNEFSLNDVVNREIDDDDVNPFSPDFNESTLSQKPKHPSLLTEEDIDALINYKEEDRRARNFKNKLADGASSAEISRDTPHKEFLDFFVLPKISGTSKLPHSHRLPSDVIKARGSKVEVADDPFVDEEDVKKKHTATVLVNRDEFGEVESIEVICGCGERTFIKFEFAEEETNYNLTEIYNKTLEEPVELDYNDLKKRIALPEVNVNDIFSKEDFSHGASQDERSSSLGENDLDKLITFDFSEDF